MRWKELECEFEYEGALYAASADVEVLTEKKDIGPEGFRQHVFAQVPVEAVVENLRIYDSNGDRLTSPAFDVVQVATEQLEDLACRQTWELPA